MYEFICGTLRVSTPTHIIVEAYGLGYRLHTPVSTWTKLGDIGSDVMLFLSLYVREDIYRLYGFLRREERDLFERLIGISGVGPKTVLNLLGHMEWEMLIQAIQQENCTLLSKVPGIGKKIAERLFIELKGGKFFSGLVQPSHSEGEIQADALNALIHLGYAPLAVQKALAVASKERPDEHSLSALITTALGLLSRTKKPVSG
jgi:holliday junction DNA helicase RuvA